MLSDDKTPDDRMLAQFGAGLLGEDEAHACENYVHQSAAAADRLRQLECEDTLLESLRDTSTPLDDEDGVVDELVGKISDRLLVDHQQGSTDELVSLLAPAEGDGELGRLGNYRILSVIGTGGMGVVFAAEDIELRREVALKAMKPVLASSAFAAQRFQREARAAAAVQHDRIVTIYQVGEDRNIPFFTMQRLEGESLASRLKETDRISPNDLISLAIQITEGLSAAHRQGLLHRDIKPDNIWLQSDDDSVKILDFGLVRSADNESNLTNSGAILGTPKYMSPEQVSGAEIDQRSDLFSLGTVLYQAVTGRSPFLGGNVVSTLMSVTNDTLVAPHDIHRDTPPALSHLIMRLLEKDPDQRYASADELLDDLRAIRDGAAPRLPSRQATRRWYTNALGWGLTAFSVLMLAIVIQVQTNRGTLLIEAEEGVIVETGKEGVWLRDKKTKKKLRVSVGKNRLPSGDYEIVLEDPDSGWQASASSFTLRRGDEQRVVISLKPPARKVGPAGAEQRQAARPKPLLIPPDKDLFQLKPGQPLFSRALVRQPKPLKGFRSWTWVRSSSERTVGCIAPNPVRDLIATGNSVGEIRIWKGPSESLLHVLPGESDVQDLAWSPDGSLLVAAYYQPRRRREIRPVVSSARIWKIDDNTATLIREMRGNFQRIAWSPDGSRVAFGGDSVVQLLDANSVDGSLLPNSGIVGRLTSHPWSPDGRQIVTQVGREGIKIWDVDRQSVFHSITGAAVWHPQWHREGRYLAYFKARNAVSELQVNRNGSIRFDMDIEIWDTKTLRSVKTIQVAKNLEFKPPRFGTADTRAQQPGFVDDQIVNTRFARLQWSPSGNRLASLIEGRFDIWDVVTGRLIKHVGKFGSRTRSSSDTRGPWRKPRWGKDGKTMYATSRDGGAVRWNIEDSSLTWIKKAPVFYYTLASMVRGGKLVVGRLNAEEMKTRMAIWDIARQTYQLKTVYELDGSNSSQSPFEESSLSPDGKRFVTLRTSPPKEADASRRSVRTVKVKCAVKIFDVETGKLQLDVKLDVTRAPRPEWSPDGKLIAIESRGSTASRKYEVVLIDTTTGKHRTVESPYEIEGMRLQARRFSMGSPRSNQFGSWFQDSRRRIQWHDYARLCVQDITNNEVQVVTTAAGEAALKALKESRRPPQRPPTRNRGFGGRRPRVSDPITMIQGAVASTAGGRMAVLTTEMVRSEAGGRTYQGSKIEFWDLTGKKAKRTATTALAPLTQITKLVFAENDTVLHVTGQQAPDSKLTLATIDVATAKVKLPMTEIEGASDYRGLGSRLSATSLMVNNRSSGIDVFNHKGKRLVTLLVSNVSNSSWPHLVALTPAGDFAEQGVSEEKFKQNMVFVGLRDDGRVTTRTAGQAITEFGFSNQGVKFESLFNAAQKSP